MKIVELEELPIDWIQEHILLDTDASWTPEGATNISSFLTSHKEQFACIGYYEDGLQGVLVYRPEDLRMILIGVSKERRRQGYGSALVDGLKAKANDIHLARIEANAASTALGFYTANQFEAVGQASHAGGLSFTPMEYLIGKEMLGKTVTVEIDHPYGSFHPTIADATYPCNFGYVSTSINDGMQDAWVIGPKEPLEKFTGVVIGIIYHKDGASRWIVSSIGMTIKHQEIINLIGFDEQYYESQILWANHQ